MTGYINRITKILSRNFVPTSKSINHDKIPFWVMNGLGNNFLILDTRNVAIEMTASHVDTLSNLTKFDQLILLEPSSSDSDVFMRIYNADGKEVGACGNATRCVGQILMTELDSRATTIETQAGLLDVFSTNREDRILVDMGIPKFDWNEIPLACEFADTNNLDFKFSLGDNPVLANPSVVNVGNPHVIFWVDDIDSIDLATIGPKLEVDPLFPERVNVSIAEFIGFNKIKVNVWERGVGLTRACGTAACAVSVAGIRRNFSQLVGRRAQIYLPGGVLDIEWRRVDNHILMVGGIEFEYRGLYDPSSQQWNRTQTTTQDLIN